MQATLPFPFTYANQTTGPFHRKQSQDAADPKLRGVGKRLLVSFRPEERGGSSRSGIYFHTAQNDPSYGGGEITAYRIETTGQFKGRDVFTYRPNPAFIGVPAGRGGWSWRYKKMVW